MCTPSLISGDPLAIALLTLLLNERSAMCELEAVHCILSEPCCRRTVYVSEPIPHDRADTPEQPAVTTMGAIYWVQRRGLATRQDKDFDEIDWDSLETVKDLKDKLLVIPESQQTASQPSDNGNDPDWCVSSNLPTASWGTSC